MNYNNYNYLDLFHGIGGFALGAYWAGMKFKKHFCSDVEPYIVGLYAKRFPESIQLGDITKIDWEKLKSENPGKWIITGGFPCQDISCAGKGDGIYEGKRSSLWFAYRDAISVLRPKFAIVENVGAITFRGLDAVLGSLAEIGYNAEWQDIRAEDVGAPHKRERIWIVAYPTIEGLERKKSKRVRPEKSGLFAKCGWWESEPAVGRVANGVSEGLDGFDRYQGKLSDKSFNRKDRLKGLGNAIVPMIAKELFNAIKNM